MTTATFADGSTKTYTGNRDVTAAWRIIRKSDGKVIKSGWSLDTTKAQKSAEGWVRDDYWHLLGGMDTGYVSAPSLKRMKPIDRAKAKRRNAEILAAAFAAAEIEVVSL